MAQNKEKGATVPGVGASSTTSSPSGTGVEQRAHIINKDAHNQQATAGPGSLDPKDLEAPPADARRWLAKRGVELLMPKGWRFMGQFHEGRSISFNHSGTADGHTIDLSFWRLPGDVPVEKLLHAYLGEELEDLLRLGRVSSHEMKTLAGVQGLLLVGGGPSTAEELSVIDPEQLFVATDGTGRRVMSWRGAVKDQLLIISFSSPVESFFDAKPAYDAILASTNIVS